MRRSRNVHCPCSTVETMEKSDFRLRVVLASHASNNNTFYSIIFDIAIHGISKVIRSSIERRTHCTNWTAEFTPREKINRRFKVALVRIHATIRCVIASSRMQPQVAQFGEATSKLQRSARRSSRSQCIRFDSHRILHILSVCLFYFTIASLNQCSTMPHNSARSASMDITRANTGTRAHALTALTHTGTGTDTYTQ